jgi:hypothetical protein
MRYGGSLGVAPRDGTSPEEKVRLASSATPDRWGKRNCSVVLFVERPAGRISFQKRKVDHLAAAARARQGGEPRRPFAHSVQNVRFQSVRKLFRKGYPILWCTAPESIQKSSTSFPKTLHGCTESEGRPTSGSQSPRPTSFTKCPLATSADSR